MINKRFFSIRGALLLGACTVLLGSCGEKSDSDSEQEKSRGGSSGKPETEESAAPDAPGPAELPTVPDPAELPNVPDPAELPNVPDPAELPNVPDPSEIEE